MMAGVRSFSADQRAGFRPDACPVCASRPVVNWVSAATSLDADRWVPWSLTCPNDADPTHIEHWAAVDDMARTLEAAVGELATALDLPVDLIPGPGETSAEVFARAVGRPAWLRVDYADLLRR